MPRPSFDQSGGEHAPLIHVIDDDPAMRSALEDLLQSAGYAAATYASAPEFLAREADGRPACLLLDVRLPGMNGLDFQDYLANEASDLPVILISGHGDVPMTVRAMRAGALDFIEKPFREQELLDAVTRAVAESRRRVPAARRRGDTDQRIATLSPREREVISLVLTGKLNKQIAFDLSISEVTVKIHRASAMRKLGVRTILELSRIAEAGTL